MPNLPPCQCLVPSLLLSAAGQVDEEATEAKKGVQTENKLPNWWVSLERRKDTQRGVGGVAAIVAWAARLGCRNQAGALMQLTSAGILGTLRPYKHLIYSPKCLPRVSESGSVLLQNRTFHTCGIGSLPKVNIHV